MSDHDASASLDAIEDGAASLAVAAVVRAPSSLGHASRRLQDDFIGIVATTERQCAAGDWVTVLAAPANGARIRVGGETCLLPPEAFYVLAPGSEWQVESATSGVLACVVRAGPRSYRAALRYSSRDVEGLWFADRSITPLLRFVRTFLAAARSDPEWVNDHAALLAERLVRKVDDLYARLRPYTDRDAALLLPAVRRVIAGTAMLVTHAAEPSIARRVAARAGMSEPRFNALFRIVHERSPREVLREQRRWLDGSAPVRVGVRRG